MWAKSSLEIFSYLSSWQKASVFQTNQSLVKQNQDKLDKLSTLDCSNYYLELKVLYYIPCVIELSFLTIDIS